MQTFKNPPTVHTQSLNISIKNLYLHCGNIKAPIKTHFQTQKKNLFDNHLNNKLNQADKSLSQ